MAKIKLITSREILNAKGQPTLETAVVLADGAIGIASVPSGTSVGKYEAYELRDNDPKRYNGNGVLTAISNVEKIIAPVLVGIEANGQQEIDKRLIEMDGTKAKTKYGANAILSVSMAVAKAAARSMSLPLFLYLREYIKNSTTTLKIPIPCFNLINGGKHGEGNLDFQEFLVIPASSKKFPESLELGANVYSALKKIIQTNNLSSLVGLEGGFSPKLATNVDALLLLKQAIEQSNLRMGFDMFIGLDSASDNFFDDGKYKIEDRSSDLSSKDMVSFYVMVNNDYHLLYLEDGLAQDDWSGWQELSTQMSQQTIIIGDDLTATNPFRLQEAIAKKAITGIVIKPNQIGTVIEALAVSEMARQGGLKIIVSHRSGETNDDFIADFAVAVSADYVKFGAPARGERVAKYNRLLQIENQLRSLQVK
ncbi:MAG: phosphopyruvate hydratase [Candidatus Levybacteria bacterium CG10_big_fil_rev_8_21_14_0_10_35_13]|nr:MAG: phosphopyruvate hydratase [Candidatus Levybacteria bacterium CG10_big_fil_rev_8_21_14_0_10_35_13]